MMQAALSTPGTIAVSSSGAVRAWGQRQRHGVDGEDRIEQRDLPAQRMNLRTGQFRVIGWHREQVPQRAEFVGQGQFSLRIASGRHPPAACQVTPNRLTRFEATHRSRVRSARPAGTQRSLHWISWKGNGSNCQNRQSTGSYRLSRLAPLATKHIEMSNIVHGNGLATRDCFHINVHDLSGSVADSVTSGARQFPPDCPLPHKR
jgi:hypothetical protein